MYFNQALFKYDSTQIALTRTDKFSLICIDILCQSSEFTVRTNLIFNQQFN